MIRKSYILSTGPSSFSDKVRMSYSAGSECVPGLLLLGKLPHLGIYSDLSFSPYGNDQTAISPLQSHIKLGMNLSSDVEPAAANLVSASLSK